MAQQRQRCHLSSDELSRCTLECWREDARTFMWQTSLVCSRVQFPGLGPGTARLVQPWDDMQVADNEQQLLEKTDFLLFRPVEIGSALLRPIVLTSWTPLEPMSASRLSGTDSMTSIFAPEDPVFVFHSLRNDWPGPKIMWTGHLLTEPPCCSLMSPGFV